MLHPRALEGWFRYNVGAARSREVNVLELAAANGQISAIDPTVASAASATSRRRRRRRATLTPTSDPLLKNYVWQSPGKLFEHQPTVRIDYNITDNHRLSGSTSVICAERDPDYLNSADVRFPGAPNYGCFDSTRPLHSMTLRSTLSQTWSTNCAAASPRGRRRRISATTTSQRRRRRSRIRAAIAIDFDPNIGLDQLAHDRTARSWRARRPTASTRP